MITLYRLVNARHADSALSGEGARRFGGRWNPPGFSVVYASQSRALAVLETFVHLTLEAKALSFFLYEITLPKGTAVIEQAKLHSKSKPRLMYDTQEVGREWLMQGKSLALAAPSVVIPPELNYVLNVRHPNFARVRVSKPEKFSFDDRLWKPS